MEKVRRMVSMALCAVLALAAFPRYSTAAPVNHAVASDPEAVQAALEAMSIEDMPEELAEELRGEAWRLPNWLKSWLIRKAQDFLPKKIANKLIGLLEMSASPEEMRRVDPSLFGWLVSMLPDYLRPNIANSY